MVMVKPALPYLDVIRAVRRDLRPAGGRLQRLRRVRDGEGGAAAKGWIDEERMMREILTSIRRAGADVILTYHAKDFARRS